MNAKRIIAMTLALLMTAGTASCGNTTSTADDTTAGENNTSDDTTATSEYSIPMRITADARSLSHHTTMRACGKF